ncbi:peptidylprolyl isomerase [Devosia faecipullorum]|uniref:peptidylprolyl isomerase n=1 Tax=Devosia faecipullorum TaxID=2755039 RepID=UPI00187B1EF0|nr:peptidylprolyl isomerase [Devosia faecipullorum]MBE7731849.1 peptidylprolyl isomerase [Devosia faecipullorum]
MTKFTRRTFAALALGATLFAAPVFAQDGNPHLILTLEDGVVDIELLPEIAPLHVERVVTLTEQGLYDGVVFHRVIDGFMAQTGDVKNGNADSPNYNLAMAGTGGSELPNVQAEFNSESFVRGVLGAARSQDPNSFNSQFFITTADASFLDRQYTVFGKVVSGMEAVDALEKGPQEQNGAVANPDRIVKASIEYK